MEPVTAILLEREREAASLKPMVTYSLIAHTIAVLFIVFAPVKWTERRSETPRTVMTISLGSGAPGPQTGGMTPITGRAVQTTAPAPTVAKPAPVLPPAARTPAMVLPSKMAPKPAPKQEVKTGPDDARGRTASKGAEQRPGSAMTETGSNAYGFAGLSTGGGGGMNGYLDVGNFCCPEYIQVMRDLIYRNWAWKQGIAAENMVKFTIERDGTLVDIEVERSSGSEFIDLASKRALLLTKRLPPLPPAFTNPTLTVHLKFQYQ